VWNQLTNDQTQATQARCGESNSEQPGQEGAATGLYDSVYAHISTANSELAKRAGSAGLMGDLGKAIEELTAADARLRNRQPDEHLTSGQAATLSIMAGFAHGYALGNADVARLHLSLTSGLSAAVSSDSGDGCGSPGGPSTSDPNPPIPPGGGGC